MSTNGGDSNGSSNVEVYESARLGSVIYLSVVGVCGIIANSLVIFVFWKYPKLRTATNLFILNLAFCDLMLSILDNSMSIASTLLGKWLFGRGGCVAYGFFHYFFICCTISTLAAISVDRFFFITRPNQTRAVQVITRKKAVGILLVIYFYIVLFTFPPCVGWNSFVEEKYFYSGCYINYGDQKSSSIGYSVIASFFLFMVPLTFMIYCYARIFVAVRRSTHRTIDRSLGTANSLKRRHPLFKRTHVQTAKMIVVVIFFSMIVWVPYTIVSLIKAANREELIAPLVSHITVLVAKSCVIYNVLIYAILNRKLKAAILDVICCGRQSFSLVGSPSPGGGTARNRISRILSETEAPSHVIEAQRNRLSALTIQQSSEQLNEENVSTPHSAATKPKNGVVKNVEFHVDQRKDSVIMNEEKDAGLRSRESLAFENDNSNMDEQFVRRKRLSKITRHSYTIEGNHIVGNGFPINQIESVTPEKLITLQQGVNDTEPQPICFNSRDSTSRSGERKDAHQVTGSRLSSLSTGAGAGSFQRVHHLYSSRSGARNKKTVSPRNALSTLSSPSQLYKKGTRPVSTQHVSKRISPDSGCARGSTSTDQESDHSREHSCEGSVVRRSLNSTPRHGEDHRKPRSVNTRYQPARRKSHRRSSCADPLQTSPQELLEIQNYWKRMSLCLDDIDLDEVTRDIEMV